MSASGRVVFVAGRRTPFARAGGELAGYGPVDLSMHALNGLLDAVPSAADAVDMLRWGIVVLDPRIPQLARELVLRSRLSPETRAVTLSDNCITGASAVVDLARAIGAGRAEVAIAGGVESMSNPALLFRPRASRIFLQLARSRTLGGRLRHAASLRPGDFLPQPPAATEPSTGLSMGEHCEQMVKAWRIPRQAQDAFALRSHRRASAASVDGRLVAEIQPLDGHRTDPLIRIDTSAQKLAALAPVFDQSGSGTITAGSSSPLSDGAAALLMTSERRAERDGLEPLAALHDYEFAAIAPADGLLMAPGVAVPRLLARHGVALAEIDLLEVHEAFAGQVLCNLAAWERGWKAPPIGTVEPERLNPLGGSIAIGHPFAATGIRMLSSVMYEMRRRRATRALVSICGAGATAAALLLERV